MSKLKLALGAAGLFLFIVGIKRSFRIEPTETEESAAGLSPDGQRQEPTTAGAPTEPQAGA